MTVATFAPPVPASDSILRINLRKFRRDHLALAAAVAVVLFVLVAIFAPWVAPYDP